MNCIICSDYLVVNWRILASLSLFAIFLFGDNRSNGVDANSIKYSRHGGPVPLVMGLRSIQDSSSTSDSNVGGKTMLGNREESVTAAVSNTGGAGGEGSGVGEILLPKTFPLSAQEPTCEQLRAMWIFSKRQSRAAEITNEIPTYRDPFAYNVWEPYYSTTRSLGSVRMVSRPGERSRSPVFGRVISREPIVPQQRVNIGHRQRHMMGAVPPLTITDQNNFFGSESKTNPIAANNGRRNSQFRYVGAANGGNTLANVSGQQPNSVAIQGSFQKLKELIWTERAKELTQQRRAEEMAARAAVLKEIAKGQNINAPYKPILKSDTFLMDQNRSPDRDVYEHAASDDHRAGSIAGGHSQVLDGAIQNQKIQNRNAKNIGGTPRSYNTPHSQKANFDGSNGSHRPSRHMLPRIIASSYSYENTGIPKAYPVRPSHFRERNRSLFKQHSPNEYFQREFKRNPTYGSTSLDTNAQNNMLQELINKLGMEQREILKPNGASWNGASFNQQREDNQNWLDGRYSLIYDDEDAPNSAFNQDGELLDNNSDYY